MWQMVWRRSWPEGLRADPKDHSDVLGGHLNLFDQRPNNLAAQVPVGIGQPGTHFDRELVKPPDEQLELVGSSSLVGLPLCLLLQGGDALAQAPEPRLELRFANETLGIAVNEAAKPLAQLGQLRCRGAALGLGATVLHR